MIKNILILLVSIGIESVCFAQNNQTSGVKKIGWNECLKLAETNNLSIKSSFHELNSSRYDLKSSYLNMLPSLNLTGEYNKSDLKDWNLEWGYKAEFVLPDTKNYYLIRSSRKKVDLSENQKRLDYIKTVYEIKEAFLNLYFSHKEVELYDRIVKRAYANMKLSQTRYQSGRDARWTYEQSSYKYEEHLDSYQNIKKNLLIQNQKLKNLIYPPNTQDQSMIYPDISDLDSSIEDQKKVLDRIKDHPKIKQSLIQVEQAQLSYNEALWDFLPDLSLWAKWNRIKQYSFDPRESSWKKSWSVGVTMNLAILSMFDTYMSSSSKHEKLKVSQLDYQQQLSNLKTQIDEAFIAYENSLSKLKLSELSLKASQSRASSQQKEYEVGLTDYSEWNNSNDQLVMSELALLSAQKNNLLALANLKQVIGE